jgi:hypothetical protein
MPQWEWKELMYGLQQPFRIRTPDNENFDLTGMTVTLYVWDPAGLEFSLVGILDAVPTTGLCYFTPIVGNFAAGSKGTYRFEVEMTQAGEVVKTKDYVLEITGTRP